MYPNEIKWKKSLRNTKNMYRDNVNKDDKILHK